MSEWPEYTHDGGSPLWRAVKSLAHIIENESDRWFLWVPVCFGAGIGLYFALWQEPAGYLIAAGLVIALSLCAATRSLPLAWIFSIACLCAVLGFGDAKLRTASLAQPGAVKSRAVMVLHGWIEKTEIRLGKGQRITLRVFASPDALTTPLPQRVRYTSRFKETSVTGAAIEARVLLRPLPEPVMPGGFDFARKAYFAGLGAVGFAIAPAKPLKTAPTPPFTIRLRAQIDGLRNAIERRILKTISGQPGAVIVALITGQRGRISEQTLQALRHSGLAHMLAISGLHMALMAGSLYWILRAGAAAFPALALRIPIKKWAAILALLGGAFYLAISGASIATQRAFLMMAIVFTAILLDRPALTLRNVALAACVILVLFPESLLNVSFQMSFAAVTALVAVYEHTSTRKAGVFDRTPWGRTVRKVSWYLGGIALTTLVAGIAIAPFAAFHFHKLAQYSLIGNLLAMPVFGLAVMPAALGVLIAMPFGLETVPLHIMAWGVSQVIAIASEVSSWPGAVVRVASMPVISLLALTMGGLWLCLWRTRWRLAGLAIASIGLVMAGDLPKPDMIIGREGKLLAVRTHSGKLSVTGGKRSSYSLEQWLRADGDSRDPLAALGSEAFKCDALACIANVKGRRIAFVRHPAALAEECARADIVVAQIPINRRCPSARVSVDRIDLWAEGAHAIYLKGQSIHVETVAGRRGNRPWTRMIARRRKPAPGGSAYAGDAPGR